VLGFYRDQPVTPSPPTPPDEPTARPLRASLSQNNPVIAVFWTDLHFLETNSTTSSAARSEYVT
jgi:hypothetical protein